MRNKILNPEEDLGLSIRHHKTYGSLTVYEDYLAIYPGGNGRSKAIVLSILEQHIEALPANEEYVVLSYREFEQSLHGFCSYNTIIRCLTELEEERMIERRTNTTRLTVTYEYRLCIQNIQTRIDALPERNYKSKKKNRSSFQVNAFALYPILEKFQGKCAYCQINPAEVWDHLIPVAKGGLAKAGNLIPACYSCNSAKGDTDLAVWLQRKGISPCPALQYTLAELYGNNDKNLEKRGAEGATL